ncbi:MAG: glycosyltransferase family 4 protein [Chloroflexi bacterium]|nr:glycosyltransferase family 4 protein [Chloroflexota bacterium]
MERIGIDARLTYYRQGGISQMIYHLIKELPHIDPAHDYVILHSRKDTRDLTTGPNQRRAICWTPAHHRLERIALAVETLPLRLDLLHSPDFIPPIDLGPKSVITIHDLTFLHYPDFLTKESRRYYNGQIDAAVARADHIITDSEATRQDVLSLLGAAPDKVTTVWLGLDPHFAPATADAISALCDRYALHKGYILFVGTFEPRKNLPGLLRAYASLSADAPQLVIAGRQGWLTDEIHALAAELRVGQRVVWLEDVPYADLPALYSGASVLCLPSFYEGFGFPPLEAMACGTPVVVANRASLPEIVGDAAVLVAPDSPESIAEGIMSVLSDETFSAALRERGRKRAQLFDWRETTRRVHAIYEQVLST